MNNRTNNVFAFYVIILTIHPTTLAVYTGQLQIANQAVTFEKTINNQRFMKQSIILVLLLFCLQINNAQTLNQSVTEDGKEKLLGPINKEGLQMVPYKEWFDTYYDSYLPHTEFLAPHASDLQEYTIKVFMGTWCGDSKRQVPKFYKTLEAVNFPMEQLEVYALNSTKEQYKQGPNGEEKGYNIHRVPTFIFYKNDKEVHRIVETPKRTFEYDITAIIEDKYRANYRAANYLQTLLDSTAVADLKQAEQNILYYMSEWVHGSKELNTLGYVYLRAGETDKALYIFDINTKLFPYSSNVFDSLGEAYFITKNYEASITAYEKVLAFNPKDKNALEMLETIKNTKK